MNNLVISQLLSIVSLLKVDTYGIRDHYSLLIGRIHMCITLGWHVRYNAPTSGETTDVIHSLNLSSSVRTGGHLKLGPISCRSLANDRMRANEMVRRHIFVAFLLLLSVFKCSVPTHATPISSLNIHH